MNPEVKAEWIKALRSGEYKQGTGALKKTGNSYCCLGVLCDLHSKDTGNGWAAGTGSSLFRYQGALTYPTPSVYEWSGLPEAYKDVLASKNDNGVTFNEIADYIDEHL